METRTLISFSNDEVAQLMDLSCWEGYACCYRPNTKEAIIGLGAREVMELRDNGYRAQFEAMENSGKLWMGFLSYELKNEFEKLSTQRPHPMDFPDACFFVPKVVLRFNGEVWMITEDHAEFDWINPSKQTDEGLIAFDWKAQISKAQYLEDVEKLLAHIRRGDIYEINYCQSFISPINNVPNWKAFQRLNEKTNAPYAAYLSLNKHRFLCASPELFLRKQGVKLFSSPIKGTIRRGSDDAEDIRLKTTLKNDVKERAENVMIVDLVRNDLSRVAEKNTVAVEELFEVYSFQTVHHMISTVSCTKRQEATLYDVLKATFPMGSMTGAPKISAMKLADEMEFIGRGVYSGSIGCIFPNGDYEFNVVIRTIMVDLEKKIAMYHVGGAITALCNPEQEFEETMLKGKALMNFNP